MIDYLVVSLYNTTNNYNIFVYQKSRTEFKIKSQIGHTSYSIDYVWGLPDLARTLFCFLINGFSLVTNNINYEFGHAIHSGDFSGLEEQIGEPPILTRASNFRTAYEEPAEERAEEPVEDLLIRTENVILDPEVELPWKLAD